MKLRRLLSIVGPGVLVAATGVGAGDLATASLTGSRLGVAILWAVWVGALLKFSLNEGLARWQLATGETFLDGAARRFGRSVHLVFLAYLLAWSFFVGAALMSACGVTAHAMAHAAWPETFSDAQTGKIVFGLIHSAVGLVLVLTGGYRLFEKVMSVSIGIMFVTVVITALRIATDWPSIAMGTIVPRIPQMNGPGVGWTIALMGGVGGTVTVLCYGYWIREKGREGPEFLRDCRIDLAVGYSMTAVFGMAMVVIGSRVTVDGKGAGLIVDLAELLREPMGTGGMWLFLLGAWAAVFSSLLGVWQSVPYLFADCLKMARHSADQTVVDPVDEKSFTYRWYVAALATVPAIGLWHGFAQMQKLYAIVGAAFMPALAGALLIMNGDSKLVGEAHVNRAYSVILLVATLCLFLLAAWFTGNRLLAS